MGDVKKSGRKYSCMMTVVTVIVMLGLLAALVGCGTSRPVDSSSAQPSDGQAHSGSPKTPSLPNSTPAQTPAQTPALGQNSAAPAGTAVKIKPMEYWKIQATISQQFPIEMAVADGEVTFAQEQGNNYDYEVVVSSATPEQVLDWYRRALGERSWITAATSNDQAREQDGSYYTEWNKGGAQKTMLISAGKAGSSIVKVTLATTGDLSTLQ